MENDFRQTATNAPTAGAAIGEGLSSRVERSEKHTCLMEAISGIDSVLVQLNALDERIATPTPSNQTETAPEPDCSTLEAVLDAAPAIISAKTERALQLIQSINARLF